MIMNIRILLIAAFLLPLVASGQVGRLKGGKFFEVGVGFRGPGPNVNAYGGITFSTNLKGKFGGGIGSGRVADISYQYIFVDGLASYSFYNINRSFFLNGIAGVSMNGDLINSFEATQYDKKFSFNYGVVGGLEGEFYASKRMIILLTAQQRYYIKKDFGNWRYQVGAAIRFTL